MKNFKKNNFLKLINNSNNLKILIFGLLSFYPILPFHLTSKILIFFFLISFFTFFFSSKEKILKGRIKDFIIVNLYFFFLTFSISYSKNFSEAITKIVNLIPLFFLTIIISYNFLYISKVNKRILFLLFCLVNIIYTFFLCFLFIEASIKTHFSFLSFLSDYDKFQYIANESTLFVHKAYFSMGFVLCAIFLLNDYFKRKTFKWFYLLGYFYFSVWLIYAFSFPNIISLILSSLILLYTKLNKKKFLILVCSLLSILTVVFLLKIKDRDVQRGVNFIKSTLNNEYYEINDNRRIVYSTVFKILEDSNFKEVFFGYGIGDVNELINKKYKSNLLNVNKKNLLLYSEEFDNDYWYKKNIIASSNIDYSPQKHKNADLIYSNNKDLKSSYSISTFFSKKEKGLYTFSIYVKPNNSDYLILRLGSINQKIIFNLKNSSVLKEGEVVDYGIQKVEGNWCRCFITSNLEKDFHVLIGLSNKTGDYHFLEKETKSLQIWGAQLEKGILTNYEKSKNERLTEAIQKRLNTHNNYLFILLSSGAVGLFSFLLCLFFLFKKSIFPISILKLSFCIIILLNFITENILSRQWGITFVFFSVTLLFTRNKKCY